MKTETEPSVFNPDKTVALSTGEKIEVKLLRWKVALKFFDTLRQNVKGLLDEKNNLTLDAGRILEAISGNIGLLEWLVKEATGKDDLFLEKVDLGDMAKMALKAIEINLGTVASEIKNVRSRFAAMTQPAEAKPKLNPTSPPSATP